MEGSKYTDNNITPNAYIERNTTVSGGGSANENGYLRPINRGSNINNQSVVCG